MSHLLDRLISRAVASAPRPMEPAPEPGLIEIEAVQNAEVNPTVPNSTALPEPGPMRSAEALNLTGSDPTGDVTVPIAAKAPAATARDDASDPWSDAVPKHLDPTVGVSEPAIAPVAKPPTEGDDQDTIARPIRVTFEPESVSARSEPGVPRAELAISATDPHPAAQSGDTTGFRDEPDPARRLRRHTPTLVEPETAIRPDPGRSRSRHLDAPIDQPTQVTVTIGRIEVLGPTPKEPVAPPPPPADSVHLTLGEYMARRRPGEQ